MWDKCQIDILNIELRCCIHNAQFPIYLIQKTKNINFSKFLLDYIIMLIENWILQLPVSIQNYGELLFRYIIVFNLCKSCSVYTEPLRTVDRSRLFEILAWSPSEQLKFSNSFKISNCNWLFLIISTKQIESQSTDVNWLVIWLYWASSAIIIINIYIEGIAGCRIWLFSVLKLFVIIQIRILEKKYGIIQNIQVG